VRRLADGGYREMVLTGIHLGHFGVDWNVGRPREKWFRLADLLRRIVQISGDFRVRLSSIEVTEVTRALIEVMAENPDRICPHLHICLQSGSNAVLQRMKRRWCTKRFVDRCELVRQTLDQPALTTDVIVGFPGETDQDFAATCRTVCHLGFSKIHIFPFSARRGTPAADMAGQVPKPVKSQRVRRLAAVERELRDQYFASLEGRRLRVLVESPLSGSVDYFLGTSCRYAPVRLPAESRSPGDLVDITAGSVENGKILGTRIPCHSEGV